MLVVVEPAVDSSAVLKIELALGGFPFARLVLVILKHLCGEKAEVSPLPSLVGERDIQTQKGVTHIDMHDNWWLWSQVNSIHGVTLPNKEEGGQLQVMIPQG